MIRTKEIVWESKTSGWTDGSYHTASVENITFIMVPEVDGKFYIHPTSVLIRIKGNKGIDEWGWFDDIEQAKSKSEEVIRESILSLIDTRDYNINKVLGGHSK